MKSRVLVVLMLVLGGCSVFGDDKPPPPCPGISVPDDARRAVIYRPGPGRDPSDIRYEAAIVEVRARCVTAKGRVTVQTTIEIVARRGPAAEDRRGRFAYFVAITDRDRKILAKQTFPADIDFPERVSRAGLRDEVEQSIPLKPGQSGADYLIFVGFQLNAAQLNDARRR